MRVGRGSARSLGPPSRRRPRAVPVSRCCGQQGTLRPAAEPSAAPHSPRGWLGRARRQGEHRKQAPEAPVHTRPQHVRPSLPVTSEARGPLTTLQQTRVGGTWSPRSLRPLCSSALSTAQTAVYPAGSPRESRMSICWRQVLLGPRGRGQLWPGFFQKEPGLALPPKPTPDRRLWG